MPVPSIISAYLPQGDGYLPAWLLFVSIVATFNSLQNYITLTLTKRVYSRQPELVNTLSSRTFGTWTFLSAIVRLYTAYHIGNKALYDVCMWSYVIAGGHFVTEWLVFGSASLGKGLTGPLVVSSTSLLWMWTQREAYTGTLGL
ncbi:erg28p [Ascodesmis nigricans]|uniref:Erg28p n=1 Tax=Ascodesmis nigricans TaxID=341454 RepID=A0A4S2N0P9_9PEZI|nr:erg28p [Ascodesmis nigricans]